MDPKFQSSFIPKGPIATSATLGRERSGERGLFGNIALFVFVLSLLSAGGVWAYGQYLENNIAKKGKDLEAARSTLEPESIKELTRLNSRLVSTQSILSKHTILSPLFEFLESSTYKTVRFTDFRYEMTNKGLTLAMKGQARGYSAVALQADEFAKSKYIKNPIFSDLNLDERGNVVFSFRADLDPSIISYKSKIEAQEAIDKANAPTVVPVTPVETKPATSTATTTTTTATSSKPSN
ncbi:MAG: putative pilN [Parcubacteria bacterium C7867-005]|nr:MAG: putative pilN [Parcubacteria bacterium C7867-005]